jgi:alpha-amylase
VPLKKLIFLTMRAAAVLALAACTMEPDREPLSAVPALGGRNEGTWYEIFTGSFADSNGDGIGDLKGIELKLNYLNDSNTASHRHNIETDGVCNDSLHIDGIWLTPIMPSPSYHKYDTKDYKDIDPQFGTLEDFNSLLNACHERGIKLIIDLVMNHSSQDHPWFQEALKEVRAGKPGRYASYYNFYYGKLPPQNETVEYAFERDENLNIKGKKYISARYYRQWGRAAENAWWEGSFWTGMPDLNWDSQALREEFKEIIDFWLTAGLDGFRLDATSWPYDLYGLGQMQNAYNGVNVDEKNIELWTWFSEYCRGINKDVYLVGECWKDEGTIANYYRSGMNYFAFGFSDMGTVPWTANGHGTDWTNALVSWERKIKTRNPLAVSAVFLSNHDKGRSAWIWDNDSWWAHRKRKFGASLYLMSPGTPFIYYGEEIGLADHDGNGVHEDSDHRGPMWWSNADSSLTPNPPEKMQWAHQASLYNNGVEEQLKDQDSLLRHYIRVINLKKRWPWLAYGYKIEGLPVSDTRLSAYRVVNPGDTKQSVVIVHSTSPNADISINFTALGFRKTTEVVYSGLSAFTSDIYEGTSDNDYNNLPGYSTFVFQEF